MKKKKEKIKCSKCGWKNPKESLFCLKCGSKLKVAKVAERASLEGLAFLHVVGSLYTILSVAFNAYVRASTFYFIPVYLFYLASGILGLCAAYALHLKDQRWMKILLSFAAVVLGLVGTSRVFYVGIMLREILERAELWGLLPMVGPAWIIFVVTGLKLGLDRNRL